jgi:hypothetical protein
MYRKILLASVLMITSANAGTIRGYGTTACHDWLRPKELQLEIQSKINNWILGFVSGYEIARLPNYVDGTQFMENKGVIEGVYAYCTEHPDDNVVDGASWVINFLLDKVEEKHHK